eukprot:TRINITY_DN388_c0_g3_i1.p1 TRINITY_DN388_c0_g3~~TRINITY_DN388_c0_g3_i1.p1  ORF type:complete len:507 (+),score=191.72 TRINITY_DN388_c0_g3_i1:113-1633(+)
MDDRKKRKNDKSEKSDKTEKNEKGEAGERKKKEEDDDDIDDKYEGPLEDPYGDEFEEEEIVNMQDLEIEDEDEEAYERRRKLEEQLVEEDMKGTTAPKKIWRPGVDPIGEDEVLDYESKDYQMYHKFHAEWPCLSFDILIDKLGYQRTKFPHTVYMVTGTQADQPQNNKLLMMKVSKLAKTQNDSDSEDDDDDDENENEDGWVDEDDEGDLVLEHKEITHKAGFNRIRSMPQKPSVVASWNEDNHVQIWNLDQWIQALDTAPIQKLVKPPTQTLDFKHEGFALAWSKLTEGRLLVGDVDKNIYLFDSIGGKFVNDISAPFVGHKSSVEDLQWSPTEAEVFASCSSDHTIKIWDTRTRNTPGVSVVAHNSDVNVISWNSAVAYLMLSGSDDGSFRIWDLRNFSSNTPAAHFEWHKQPITSVAWNPNDDSALAVASADNSVTLWDLSLEKDAEEDAKLGVEDDFPPQLLFVHQGQKDIKEIHWHPQIPGVLISTAADGFNIFKPDVEV